MTRGESSRIQDMEEIGSEEEECGLPLDERLNLWLMKEEQVRIEKMMDDLTKEWGVVEGDKDDKNDKENGSKVGGDVVRHEVRENGARAGSECPYVVELPEEADPYSGGLKEAMKFALARLSYGIGGMSLKRKSQGGGKGSGGEDNEDEEKCGKKRKMLLWDGAVMVEKCPVRKGWRDTVEKTDVEGVGVTVFEPIFNIGKSLEMVKTDLKNFNRRKKVKAKWLNNMNIEIFSCKGEFEHAEGFSGCPTTTTQLP